MRTIKFRAWDGKIMRNDLYEFKDGTLTVRGTVDDKGKRYISHLMQFTGLLDKNGKEIYEGDIVTVPNMDYDPSNGDNPVDLIAVEYKLGVFHPLQDCPSEEMEIIGNVYENPELLTQKGK